MLPNSPAVQRVFEETVAALRSAGHELVEFSHPCMTDTLQAYIHQTAQQSHAFKSEFMDRSPKTKLTRTLSLIYATTLPFIRWPLLNLVLWAMSWVDPVGAYIKQGALLCGREQQHEYRMRISDYKTWYLTQMTDLNLDAVVSPQCAVSRAVPSR